MKQIRNNWLPVKGFIALTIWPFLLVRRETAWRLNGRVKNHEEIHARQQKEMLLVGFYLWYGIEWAVRKIAGQKDAYRNISFEREAYDNDQNRSYFATRRLWSWIKYLRKG